MSTDPARTLSSAGARAGPGTQRVCRLLVAFGPQAGLSVAVAPGQRVTLGREGPEVELALRDGEVSRRHAAIERSAEGDSASVVDLSSRNGTFLDGVRCGRGPLVHGSVLRVGATVLVWEDFEAPGFLRLAPATPQLPGPSLALERVRGEIALVAPQMLAVMICGETGVGKELVAQELHRQSGRSGPFVPVNCAAIAATLAESELFGHAAGAFTGATSKSEGLFGAARGGTLFLDEIGELPVALQPKLLRALGHGEVRPVGATQSARVDVRIVAATHRELSSQTEGFRGDLLARLSGWRLHVPPLRSRKADVLALSALFLDRTGSALSLAAAEALLLYGWPHNVRELEQALAAAAVRAAGGRVLPEHLPAELFARPVTRAAPVPTADRQEEPPTREELCRALEAESGNMAKVAERFGKDRRQVYRWVERLGIEPELFRKLT